MRRRRSRLHWCHEPPDAGEVRIQQRESATTQLRAAA